VANKRDPNFLCIGAQKAGTTSLINYLNFHPEIFGRLIMPLYKDRMTWRKNDNL